MLLMINWDPTVWVIEGVKHQEGEHEGRWTMLKICVALNKERGICNSYQSSVEPISQRYNFFSFDGTTKSVNGTTIIGCIVPDHIRLVKIV